MYLTPIFMGIQLLMKVKGKKGVLLVFLHQTQGKLPCGAFVSQDVVTE